MHSHCLASALEFVNEDGGGAGIEEVLICEHKSVASDNETQFEVNESGVVWLFQFIVIVLNFAFFGEFNNVVIVAIRRTAQVDQPQVVVQEDYREAEHFQTVKGLLGPSRHLFENYRGRVVGALDDVAIEVRLMWGVDHMEMGKVSAELVFLSDVIEVNGVFIF